MSHPLSADTPVYAGGEGISIESEKNICCGDSCNTTKLTLSNHLGSHVDAPRHFIEEGKTTDSYEPSDWVFENPLVVHVEISDSEIINHNHIDKACAKVDDADFVLVRTGFEKYRGQKRYWENQPGYAPELADYLKNRFQSFTAIGMDTISISSCQHRDMGRETHRAFLGNGTRIFEDLSLAVLDKSMLVFKIVALPLRFENSDGAPCSMIGWVGEH